MQPAQVKSALRAIEILEFFSRVRRPQSMSDIAQALGYPLSSTTVLLKTLIGMGYLSFDRRDRLYFPTPKVASLGDWVSQALFGSGRILDVMRDVHAATGETTSIDTANDIQLQYLQIIQSVHPLRFHVDEGAMRPLTQSAVGWLLMSQMPNEKIDDIVRRANIATKKSGETVKSAEIMERVRTIRKTGHAWAENIPFLGGATLCVLLPVTIHDRPVALGIGGALERMRQNRDRYLTVLQRAARAMKPTS
jgi:DNA-binding IclR family transcriptional regulator